jgi:hypothetical protein
MVSSCRISDDRMESSDKISAVFTQTFCSSVVTVAPSSTELLTERDVDVEVDVDVDVDLLGNTGPHRLSMAKAWHVGGVTKNTRHTAARTDVALHRYITQMSPLWITK